MGSGKTTVGSMLSYDLKFPLIDLDTTIETKLGMAIEEIFEKKGEDYFREIERETLQQIADDNVIIACGGGTPCYFDSMQWIRSNGFSVYLKTSEEKLLERLLRIKETRPLIKDMDAARLKSFIHEKLIEREPFYKQANLTARMEQLSVDDLIEKINEAILLRE
jgi:shikimate kinase